MKTSELKNLSIEFSEFISSNGFAGILSMSEFWAAKFGCNNPDREDELFNYWLKN